MKIFDYLSEGGKNYIQTEEAVQGDYITQMLIHNNISGFVGARLRSKNAENRIVYLVTGLVPLTQLVEIRRLSAEGIEALLRSYLRVIESMDDYLLPPDRLIIEPEHIYQSYGKKDEFLWIYGGNETRGRRITPLFEFLLDKIEKRDDRAANLIFSLYQSCMNYEAMGIGTEPSSMLSMLAEKAKELLSSQKVGIEVQVNDIISKENNLNFLESKQAIFKQGELDDIKKTTPTNNDLYYKERLPEKELKGSKTAKKKKDKQVEKNPKFSADKMKSAFLKAWKYLNSDIGSEPEEKLIVEERDESYKLRDVKVVKTDETLPKEKATTLLTNGLVNNGIFCLKPFERNEEKVMITSYPFFIGKADQDIHLRLDDNTVSRYHARIDREGEEFFLTDLGSTNGTFLNGTRLIPFERLAIKVEDILVISRKKYEFTFLS